MSNDAAKPASTDSPNPAESKESKSTEKTPTASPKKTSWKDWLLIFVAVMTLGNGVAEVTDVQRDKDLARGQIEISQRFDRDNSSSDRESKRYLHAGTQGQVTTIKEFMARNQAEIESVDHYHRQLTTLARRAINIANDTIAKRNTDDALSKAMKDKIELLESLLGQQQQPRQKRKFEEAYELASHTEELLKLCGAFWAKAISGDDKGNKNRLIPVNYQI